jgi:hypothetical protein
MQREDRKACGIAPLGERERATIARGNGLSAYGRSLSLLAAISQVRASLDPLRSPRSA